MILLQSDDFENNNYGYIKIYDNVDGRTSTATGSSVVNFYAYPNSSNAYDAGFLIHAGDARNEIDWVQLATHSGNSSSSYFSDAFIYPNGTVNGSDELGLNIEWADTFDVNFIWRISTYAGFANMYVDDSAASVTPHFKRRTTFMGNIKEGTKFNALMPAIGTQGQSNYPSWDNALITASIYIFEAPASGTYTIKTSNSSIVAPVPYPRISIYDYQDFSLEYQLKDGGSKIGLSNTQGQQEILQTVDLKQGYHVIMLHNGYQPNLLEQLAGTGATQRSTEITITLEKFYINYDANGGQGAPQKSGPYSGTSSITIPTTQPTKDGYSFQGWSENPNATESSYIPGRTYSFSGGTTLYAVWTPRSYTYTISYRTASGKILTSETITRAFGTVETIPPGKTFNGYITPGSQTVSWDSTSAKTIVFTYTPEEYSIEFDLQGGIGVTNSKYTIESSNIKLGTPTKEGYSFSGWTGSNGTSPQQSVTIYTGSTGKKNYTANWTPKTYTYILEYKTVSGKTFSTTGTVSNKFGGTYQVSTSATFKGYEISEEARTQTVTWDSTTAKTITFIYTPITYTITYQGLEDAAVGTNPINYNIETEDLYLNNPSKVGYTFQGWGGTGLSGSSNKTVVIATGSTGNRSYTAYWKIQKFAFSIGTKDIGIKNTTGTSSAGSYQYKSTITLNAALNTGYTFSKWAIDTADTNLKDLTSANSFFEMPAADVKATPVSTPIVCKVYLNNNNATSAGTATAYIKYNTGWYSDANTTNAITSITKPKKTGYIFKGYFTDSGVKIINENGVIENNTTVAANNTTITLYAEWETIICKIVLNNNNADISAGTDIIYLKYNNGWYSDIEATSSISKLPSTPQKTGYTFNGYYDENGTKIINADSTIVSNKLTFSGDNAQLVLYANWLINSYNVTFTSYYLDPEDNETMMTNSYGQILHSLDGNTYSAFPENSFSQSYSYNDTIYLQATPNEGYSFLHWENDNAIKNRVFNVPAENYYVKAIFGPKAWSLTPKLKNNNDTDKNGIIKFWIRVYDETSGVWGIWNNYSWNSEIAFSTQAQFQVMIEDGELYEYKSMKISYIDESGNTQVKNLNCNETYQIKHITDLTVDYALIPVISNIYTGNVAKTSGYIKRPLVSFNQKINSIWCGDQQILGKAPVREYPYKEDTLLDRTLYVGSENTEIGKYGENGKYRGNTTITKVIFPKDIEITLNSYEFYQCKNLATIINLPKKLQGLTDADGNEAIDKYTFYQTKLKTFIVPESINDLNQRVFYQCKKLENIIFHSDFRYIGSYTFYQCTALKYLNLNNTRLERIYGNSFNGCSSLQYLILPNTLEEVGVNSFKNCDALKKVIYQGTISKWNSININATGNDCLTNATIYCKDGIINPKEEN